MTFLLDANVLIALMIAEHEHHDHASRWIATVEQFALCPVVEGALVRFLVRIGESAWAASQVLATVHAMPTCEFWDDSVSYADANLSTVTGHRQVTDAYLVALADACGGTLATFDRGLARRSPERTLLIATP